MQVYAKFDKELELKGWYKVEDLYTTLNRVTIKMPYGKERLAAYRTLPADMIVKIKVKLGKTNK
jgi:hypothetical protein